MELLTDSHIFIWWQDEPKKLSAKFSNAIFDTSNTIYLSLVSLWEMQLKIQTGKLHLSVNLSKAIETVQKANDLQILPIKSAHVYELENLPFHHKDPFDRLLIAQSIVENFTLVTDDPKFAAYSLNLLSDESEGRKRFGKLLFVLRRCLPDERQRRADIERRYEKRNGCDRRKLLQRRRVLQNQTK